jgi:hypothetical protein
MASMIRFSKYTEKQGRLVSLLRAYGATVFPLRAGVCTVIIVGFRGKNVLMVLDLIDDQDATNEREAITWAGHVVVVKTEDDALEAIGLKTRVRCMQCKGGPECCQHSAWVFRQAAASNAR